MVYILTRNVVHLEGLLRAATLVSETNYSYVTVRKRDERHSCRTIVLSTLEMVKNKQNGIA